MGEVHAARSPRGAVVAVKLITGAGIRDAETVARFKREGEVLQALSHPAIVPVYEVGVDAASKTPFLAMEHIDGEDLERLVEREGPLPPTLAVAIGLDLCGALAHAHARGILHRDIKPANVLVPRTRARGYAILCDFGLSKRLGSADLITASAALLGTALYIAPEQTVDAHRASEKSDVWSLAMTLYVALSGRSPFEGLVGFDLLKATATVVVPDVRALVPHVPADVAAALRSSLVIDPQQRFSLAELRRALRQTESAGHVIPKAPLSVPESVVSRPLRAAAGAIRSGPPGLLDAVTLPRGTYTLMTSEGAFSYSGVDDLGRVVHLERIIGAYADAGARALLEREVAAFSELPNESTVALVDFGELEGDAYVVCDAPDGRDLVREIEAAGPIPYATALQLFAESAAALDLLHTRGLCHGHLTPSSLHVRVLPQNRRLLVLHDLGIGERARAHLAALEKNRRPPSRDPRLDVLHFVTALHFAIVGQLPFGVPLPTTQAGSSTQNAPNANAVRPDAATFMAPEPQVRRALEALLKHAMQGFLSSFRVVGDELSAMRRDAGE